MNTMIDYLTWERYLKYDLSLLPEQQGQGGGMPVKTARVLSVLGKRYFVKGISKVTDATAPLLLIEPLRFHLYEEDEDIFELLSLLKSHPSKKILYCSEMALLRLEPSVLDELLSCIDIITCNCLYQANMFRYIGVKPDAILTDPIPCDVFKLSSDRHKKRVIATGNISWQKNAEYLIEIFSELQALSVETCYIGSANLWGKTSDPFNLNLEKALKAVTTYYHASLTQAETAEVMRSCSVGLWTAWHECFGMGLAELMASGLYCWMFPHGLRDERPGLDLDFDSTADAALAIAQSIDTPPECLSQTSRDWAVENVSYEAFLDQFESIIGRINL